MIFKKTSSEIKSIFSSNRSHSFKVGSLQPVLITIPEKIKAIKSNMHANIKVVK